VTEPVSGPERPSTLTWITRFAAILCALGFLTWSWRASEISPQTLVSKLPRAQEYIFGKDVLRGDPQRFRREAEQAVPPLPPGASRQEASARDQAVAEQTRQLQQAYTQKVIDGLGRDAERSIDLGLRQQAEVNVTRRLGLSPQAPRPPEFREQTDAEFMRLKELIPIAEMEAQINDEVERLRSDRAGGYFPPETDPSRIWGYVKSLMETVAMAVWGTLFAVLASVPAAFLAADRTMKALLPGKRGWRPVARRISIFTMRRLFDITRGFNEFVLALILVAIVGLGPFAGVLALAVHTFGVLGKVIADGLENARQQEIDGVTSTGAGPLQLASYAVIPQALPHIVSQSLLRFESNVRSASVLGIVGAGGIGFLMNAKLSAYQFKEVATMMILVIIVVTFIDLGCSRIMRRLV
jgi:phosphonate transport system permease protein